MDADGSFDPQDLEIVSSPVRNGTVDLMLGRRAPRTLSAWPAHARLGNIVLSAELRAAPGSGCTTSARCAPPAARICWTLDLTDRRFGYPLEMVMRAAAAGWRIGEAPVPYYPRTGRRPR